MTTKEIKREVLKLMDEKIGINMYAVLKGNQEKTVKIINIADEQDEQDNTADELLNGFVDIIKNKFSNYDEDDEVLRLSSADERKNGLYYYDLEELPQEMKLLNNI